MIYNAYSEQNETISGITPVSCGHIFAKHGREIRRPRGREDWLLFYIAKESETFYLDSAETGKEGSFILFAPWEKQHHAYLGSKTAEFYYVHFKCDALPPEISLESSRLYHTPFNRQICDTFEELIEETLQKQPFYGRRCVYKLLDILSLLERELLSQSRPDKENFERIALVVQNMNKDYKSDLTLEDYANMCSMSKYHFLRIFEKIVGLTPIEYRNGIRLQHAADLLSDEKLTVEQISTLVGYSCASYFSSSFKQKYGMSPQKYRKSR